MVCGSVRGGWAHAVARDTAMRLLEQHPDIARENIYTAVVCGDVDEVRTCQSRNDAGTCFGTQTCGASGWSQCNAVSPGAVETQIHLPLLLPMRRRW